MLFNDITFSLTNIPIAVMQVVFNITPLSIEQWVTVMKFSLPVILLDEILKLVARNFTDGRSHPGRVWKEALAALVAIVSYGYAWYLSEIHIIEQVAAARSAAAAAAAVPIH